MPRSDAPPIDSAGSDSLLNVVTGAVGILIILVLVVGEGARRAIVPAPVPTQEVVEDLQAERVTIIDVERDVHHLDSQIKTLDNELEMRRKDRELLATLIVASKQELDQSRGQLDDVSKRDYDLNRDLALAQAELERLERQRVSPAEVTPASLKIESYPTPLSKPVDGKELHIQLRGGNVTVVPVDDLVERLKNTAKEKVWKLRDYPEMTDTVGPVDGFRMRYTLIRVDAGGRMAREAGQGSYVQLDHWELVPVAADLGEPWQEALQPNSMLRAKLDQTNTRQWTVTLWVYPDSFDAFRALRKEFYQLGYHVAGRPLPDGVPIGGSPRGTKSAAQ